MLSLVKTLIKHKLAFRSHACVFIGYGTQHKGYRCLDVKIGRIYTSRHVTFDEHSFPFHQPPPTAALSLTPSYPLYTPTLLLPPPTLQTDPRPPTSHLPNPHMPPISSPTLSPTTNSLHSPLFPPPPQISLSPLITLYPSHSTFPP